MGTMPGGTKLNQVTTTKQTTRPFNSDADYYDVLELSRDCSQKEIKNAYKKLANEHHPDKGGDSKWFHLITEAFNVLSDPKSRDNYDEYGKFTAEELISVYGYITSVIEQIVSRAEDLEYIDMIETLRVTTVNNINNSEVELEKQKKIKRKFEKNEHRTKNKTILAVFKKHKGVAIKHIEGLEKDLRTFDVATVLLKDYEYNFDVKPPPETRFNPGSIYFG